MKTKLSGNKINFVSKRKHLMQALILSVVILSAFSIGFFAGLIRAQSGDAPILFEPFSLQETASYVVFADGTTVYAKNGTTGQIDFYSTNDDDVIQYCINQTTTNGGSVFVKAHSYSASVTLKDKVRLIIEKGATGITVSVDSGATCWLEDYNHAVRYFYSGGSLVWKENLSTGEFWWNSQNRTDTLLHPEQTASYIIWNDTSTNTVYAKSGSDGQIKWSSSTSASYVIQSAIDALPSSGGSIYIREGLYIITSTIRIRSDDNGIKIQGAGFGVPGADTGTGVTRLKLAANVNDYVFRIDGTRAILRDLVLDGNKAYNTISSCLYVEGTDACVENVAVEWADQFGLNWVGNYGHARNIYAVYNDMYNVNVAGSQNQFTNIVSCQVQTGQVGIRVASTAKLNRFIGGLSTNDKGIAVRVMGSLNTFVGFVIAGGPQTTHGFHIYGGSRNVFDGCVVYNVGQAANNTYDAFILESYSGTPSTGNIIKGCQIYSDATNRIRYGINEADTSQDYNIYANNIVTGAATANLHIQGANSIQDNNIEA